MINYVVMDGFIGKELVLKTTQSLKKYVASTFCQNRYSKVQDGYVGEWHHLIAWNNIAEKLAASAHKGSKVILAGEQRTRKFVDENGHKVTYEYIWVNSFDIVANPKENLSQSMTPNPKQGENEEPEVDQAIIEANKKEKLAEDPFGGQKEIQLSDDDLPF